MDGAFVWISRAGCVPARWDLRLIGWNLVPDDAATAVPRLFDGRAATRARDWADLSPAGSVAAVAIDEPEERAAMLVAGIGEVLSSLVALEELAQRVARLAAAAASLPRFRCAGPLRLDLLHRDARVGERWLGLHPREFALLWRLSDRPGERVTRGMLLADVWRLSHQPETNSIEVHISRLRAKLAFAGADHLVRTDPRGGYRLALGHEARRADWTARAPGRRVTVS